MRANVSAEAQIAEMAERREAFIRSVESLREGLFLASLGNWSPRDMVAHLIGWNRATIVGCRQIQRAELPDYDLDPGENFSKVNAEFVRQYASRDRRALLEELRASARELEAFLRSVSAEDWPRDFGVRHDSEVVTISATVRGLSEDYPHHQRQLEAWVARGTPAR